MAKNKRLGLFWGNSGLTLVQSGREAPELSELVPFAASEQDGDVKSKGISSDLKILDSIQKAIRNKGFSTTEAYISLPSRDILIRWFVIPWMKTSEIHGSVSFEAQKFIPFEIEEMAYTYYPTTVVKDNIRQIGILFVAIRKSILSRYTNICIQSGLNVVYSEPAAMSLLRVLVFKRLIVHDQITAIMFTSNNFGELIIASKGCVKFIRDFNVNMAGISTSDTTSSETEVALRSKIFRAKVINELRISFEFFSRQFVEEGIDKLITISSGLKQSFWTELNVELGIPLEVVDAGTLFNQGVISNVDGLNAHGASMSGSVSSVIDFNLSEDSSTQVSLKHEEIARQNRRLIFPLLFGVGGALLIGAMFYFSGLFLDGMRFQVTALTKAIGEQTQMSLDVIHAKTKDDGKTLSVLQTLPLSSRVTPVIVRLVKRMPKGMLLDTVTINIDDSDGLLSGAAPTSTSTIKYEPVHTKIVLNFAGFSYLKDSNAEFNQINNFLNDLKSDDLFKSWFGDVKLSFLRAQAVGAFKATSFKITCEGR